LKRDISTYSAEPFVGCSMLVSPFAEVSSDCLTPSLLSTELNVDCSTSLLSFVEVFVISSALLPSLAEVFNS